MHFFERVNSRTELPPTLGNGSLVNTLGRVSDGAQEVSSIDGDSDSKKEVDEEDDATEIENAKENNNDDTVDSGESKSFNNTHSLPDLRGIINQKLRIVEEWKALIGG